MHGGTKLQLSYVRSHNIKQTGQQTNSLSLQNKVPYLRSDHNLRTPNECLLSIHDEQKSYLFFQTAIKRFLIEVD